ncbi:MAG TPA: DUF6318 family protein [Beutenbergiaceae bacterium]|nr:DUF6318 family protein [Beutenbergiaceae bacterium]
MGLVLAVLVLAGCTGQQEEPVPEPSNGPDGQVTTPAGDGQGPDGPDGPGTEPEGEPQEPEEDYPAPERPAAMENNDIDGAEAAATYFLELVQYGYATGDTAELTDMSADDCSFCELIAGAVDEIYADGGRAVAEPIMVESVIAQIWTHADGDYAVETRFRAGAITEYDDNDELVDESPSEDLHLWLLLTYEDSWHVEGVESE